MQQTIDYFIKHIENSINSGDQEKSKLDSKAFEVPGFTSPKIRHTLNNLGSLETLRYLEVGVHKGGTFVATNYKNNMESSIAIDNWSEFSQDGETKEEFTKHCKNLLDPGYQFLEQDCFTITKEQIKKPINFYLYDGCHSLESQKRALTHFYPLLDDVFIFLVDDYNWDDSRNGTAQAIEELNIKYLYKRELVEGWWNGLLVSLCKK